MSLSLTSFPWESLRTESSYAWRLPVDSGRPPLGMCPGRSPRGVLSPLGVKPVLSGLGAED